MIGFISLGGYSTLEQDILANLPLLKKMVRLTASGMERQGVPPKCILSSLRMSEAYRTELGFDVFPVYDGPRAASERDAVKKYVGNLSLDGQWAVIARPCLGWVNEERLEHFCRKLQTTATDGAISALPTTTLNHPFWNTIEVLGPVFAEAGTLRNSIFNYRKGKRSRETGKIPKAGFSPVRIQYPEEAAALAGKRGLPRGSQELSDLYYYDQALHSFRLGGTFDPDTHSPEIIPYVGRGEEPPMHERLPLFKMNKGLSIDLRALDRMLDLYLDQKA